jgi:hypothetical protein
MSYIYPSLLWLDILASVCIFDNLLNCTQMEMTQVNAIGSGSLDSLYETMQDLGENEGRVVSSDPSDILIDVGRSNKDQEDRNSRK